MGQFDKLVEEIRESDKRKQPEKMVKIDISKNPALNVDYAKNMIVNRIDDLSDRELYEFLLKSYPILLKDIFEKDDTSFLDVVIDSRFLSQFIQVINGVQLDDLQVVYCNKLAYDYLVKSDKDEYTKNIMLSLSKAVNRDKIYSLHSIGLPDEIATFIALARFSSLKDKINIKRVNHLLMMYDAELMTAQMVIYIFEKLFDSFTELFVETMYDVYDRDTLKNMGNGSGEIYSNIGLALCTMLEGLESSVIRKVLLMYANTYNVGANYCEVRFPIKSLSVADFPRILNVVELLERNEMIIVP